MIRMGKSIRNKWVNYAVTCIPVPYSRYVLQNTPIQAMSIEILSPGFLTRFDNWLYILRRWLETVNFGFKKKRNCISVKQKAGFLIMTWLI